MLHPRLMCHRYQPRRRTNIPSTARAPTFPRPTYRTLVVSGNTLSLLAPHLLRMTEIQELENNKIASEGHCSVKSCLGSMLLSLPATALQTLEEGLRLRARLCTAPILCSHQSREIVNLCFRLKSMYPRLTRTSTAEQIVTCSITPRTEMA